MSTSIETVNASGGFGTGPKIDWLPIITNSYWSVMSPLARMMCSSSSRFMASSLERRQCAGFRIVVEHEALLEAVDLCIDTLTHFFGQHCNERRSLTQLLGVPRSAEHLAPRTRIQDLHPLAPQADRAP